MKILLKDFFVCFINCPVNLQNDWCINVAVCDIEALDENERLMEMKRILTEELPMDNYFVLKYIIHFLTEVTLLAFTYCSLCGLVV